MHKNREAVWPLDVTLVELDVHLQAEVVASVHEEVACVPPNDDGDVERAFIRRRVKGEGEPCFKHFLVVVKVETLRTLYVPLAPTTAPAPPSPRRRTPPPDRRVGVIGQHRPPQRRRLVFSPL
jgi:hypothetical protein